MKNLQHILNHEICKSLSQKTFFFATYKYVKPKMNRKAKRTRNYIIKHRNFKRNRNRKTRKTRNVRNNYSNYKQIVHKNNSQTFKY